jgi:transglutaminase-like putative cysteine protease
MDTNDLWAKPWRIPDEWNAQVRVNALTSIAWGAAMLPIIRDLAKGLETPETLLAWVQSRGYKRDPVGDWWQGVGFTARNGGDCEDLATLFVALAFANRWAARIAWINQPGQPLNHVTAQIQPKQGGPWVWAEPSLLGARLGEHPYVAASRLHPVEVP